jgi:ABC-2 type transport system ATP-binding protein
MAQELRALIQLLDLQLHNVAVYAHLPNVGAHIVNAHRRHSAFIGTVEQLGETVGKHYNITIQTETGTGKYESDNIGETLLTLLVQCREKGETILDIQIGRGSLEQHFMKIAKGV